MTNLISLTYEIYMLLITYVTNNKDQEITMDLRATILGILSWKPLSGYDLKGIICDSEVYYWSGNNNQIYKSLVELQNEGLVTHHVQMQQGKPAKKIYTINEAGLAELKRSLMADPELPEVHKGFLIQLAWSGALSDEEVLDILGRYAEEVSNRLAMLKAQAVRTGIHQQQNAREKYLWRRINENLIQTCRAELEWVNQIKLDIQVKKYPVEETN